MPYSIYLGTLYTIYQAAFISWDTDSGFSNQSLKYFLNSILLKYLTVNMYSLCDIPPIYRLEKKVLFQTV